MGFCVHNPHSFSVASGPTGLQQVCGPESWQAPCPGRALPAATHPPMGQLERESSYFASKAWFLTKSLCPVFSDLLNL